MAFHPLTAGSTKGEGRAVQPPERLQEDVLRVVSSYFLQRYLCYLTAPANAQCSGQASVFRHGQQEVWIKDSRDFYLLTLSGNTTQDVGVVNAGTFSIIPCPVLRDKGDIKFRLCL